MKYLFYRFLLLVVIIGALVWIYKLPKPQAAKVPFYLHDIVAGGANPSSGEVSGPFDHIKVGPYTYKVKWINGLMTDCVDGEVDDGCTSVADSLIRISVIADKPHQRAIVLHEILHVVINTTMADSPERMAYSSPLLLEIIRENPELMKFLEEK